MMLDTILTSIIETLQGHDVKATDMPGMLGLALAVTSWEAMEAGHKRGLTDDEARRTALDVLADIESIVAAWTPGADIQSELQARFKGSRH